VRRGGGVLLDEREMASVLGESSRSVRTWRKTGVIPAIVVGHRTVRFKLEDVLAALQKRVVRAKAS